MKEAAFLLIYPYLPFFAWMTGFQMSEGSSSSLNIKLIFKLCFQRKGRNLEITHDRKQITHIAGVNSIHGEFNLPGVLISLNIIYICNESLIEHLSLNFIFKKGNKTLTPYISKTVSFHQIVLAQKHFLFSEHCSFGPWNILKIIFRRWIILKCLFITVGNGKKGNSSVDKIWARLVLLLKTH